MFENHFKITNKSRLYFSNRDALAMWDCVHTELSWKWHLALERRVAIMCQTQADIYLKLHACMRTWIVFKKTELTDTLNKYKNFIKTLKKNKTFEIDERKRKTSKMPHIQKRKISDTITQTLEVKYSELKLIKSNMNFFE